MTIRMMSAGRISIDADERWCISGEWWTRNIFDQGCKICISSEERVSDQVLQGEHATSACGIFLMSKKYEKNQINSPSDSRSVCFRKTCVEFDCDICGCTLCLHEWSVVYLRKHASSIMQSEYGNETDTRDENWWLGEEDVQIGDHITMWMRECVRRKRQINSFCFWCLCVCDHMNHKGVPANIMLPVATVCAVHSDIIPLIKWCISWRAA